AENVLSGALGDWEWVVNIAAVLVLLHDGENIRVDLGDGLNDRCQDWNTVWWFHHDALSHCVCEGHVIFEDIKEQAGVYLLKVQVANALWMVFDELDVVTAIVGKVAGIQAQVGVAWVGFFQEAQDFAGGTDVAVSV